MAEEPAGTAVMVRLGGREQMHERGVAGDDGAHQGHEALVGEGKPVLELRDELPLALQDAGGRGHRKAALEGWIARDRGVFGRRAAGAAG